MGRPTGLEPATPRFTILCSNQLSYDRRKEPAKIAGAFVSVNSIFGRTIPLHHEWTQMGTNEKP